MLKFLKEKYCSFVLFIVKCLTKIVNFMMLHVITFKNLDMNPYVNLHKAFENSKPSIYFGINSRSSVPRKWDSKTLSYQEYDINEGGKVKKAGPYPVADILKVPVESELIPFAATTPSPAPVVLPDAQLESLKLKEAKLKEVNFLVECMVRNGLLNKSNNEVDVIMKFSDENLASLKRYVEGLETSKKTLKVKSKPKKKPKKKSRK
jgi:hypothetical protein